MKTTLVILLLLSSTTAWSLSRGQMNVECSHRFESLEEEVRSYQTSPQPRGHARCAVIDSTLFMIKSFQDDLQNDCLEMSSEVSVEVNGWKRSMTGIKSSWHCPK